MRKYYKVDNIKDVKLLEKILEIDIKNIITKDDSEKKYIKGQYFRNINGLGNKKKGLYGNPNF